MTPGDAERGDVASARPLRLRLRLRLRGERRRRAEIRDDHSRLGERPRRRHELRGAAVDDQEVRERVPVVVPSVGGGSFPGAPLARLGGFATPPRRRREDPRGVVAGGDAVRGLVEVVPPVPPRVGAPVAERDDARGGILTAQVRHVQTLHAGKKRVRTVKVLPEGARSQNAACRAEERREVLRGARGGRRRARRLPRGRAE